MTRHTKTQTIAMVDIGGNNVTFRRGRSAGKALTMGSPEVIAAAKTYCEHGFAIVPVQSDKKPFGKNWRRHFPLNEILERLEGPDCVAIGFLGGDLNNHIVPLDFDTDEGEAWWRSQCEKAGIDPDDFPTVITPGKIRDGKRTPGRHRYVRDIRKTLGNSEDNLKPLGINVRGAGHAMLPPSPHPDGGFYRWLDRHSLDDSETVPACPDFVYDAIRPLKTERANRHTRSATTDERERRYAAAALAAQCSTVAKAPLGTRNGSLNNAALSMGHQVAAGRIGRRQVEAALLDAADACGLLHEDGERAVLATINSGLVKGMEEPAPSLEEREGAAQSYSAQPDDPGNVARKAESNGIAEYKGRIRLIPFHEIQLGRQRRHLVKGLLPRFGTAVVWGAPKCGKTFWVFDVLMHVAQEVSYRGRRVHGGPVIYCAFEGQKGMKARVEAYRQKRLPAGATVPFLLQPVTLNLIDEFRDLIGAIRDQGISPVVVALDTLNKSLVGSESNDDDMGRYVRAAAAISEAFNCLVVIVHHCGHDDKRMRGHSGLPAAIDAELQVLRDAADNIVVEVKEAKDMAAGEAVVSRIKPVDDVTPQVGKKVRPKLKSAAAQVAFDILKSTIAEIGEPPRHSSGLSKRCKPRN